MISKTIAKFVNGKFKCSRKTALVFFNLILVEF